MDDIKALLREYVPLQQEAGQLERQIEMLTRSGGLKATVASGMPSGSNISDPTAEVAKLIESLEKRRKKTLKKILSIWNLINSVKNAEERVILFDRYVEGKKWEEIALDRHFSKRQVLRIHGRALVNLKRCH